MKLNEKRIVNDIRLLSLDMIDKAGSGHPGIALDMARTGLIEIDLSCHVVMVLLCYTQVYSIYLMNIV